MHGLSGSGSAALDDASVVARTEVLTARLEGRRIPDSIRPLKSSPGLPGSHDNPPFSRNEVVQPRCRLPPEWNRVADG